MLGWVCCWLFDYHHGLVKITLKKKNTFSLGNTFISPHILYIQWNKFSISEHIKVQVCMHTYMLI
jgi:hypothetical protein